MTDRGEDCDSKYDPGAKILVGIFVYYVGSLTSTMDH